MPAWEHGVQRCPGGHEAVQSLHEPPDVALLANAVGEAHPTHPVIPSSLYIPSSHAVHAVAPARDSVPAGQAEQLRWVETGACSAW